jgi:hypothetical protein
MKSAALKVNPPAVRSHQLPDQPKPLPWKKFNRFAADAQELLEYVEEMRSIRFGADDHTRTSVDVAEDAEWLAKLMAKVREGFAQFDHDDNYEEDADDGRVLKLSHIAKRLSVLAVSFPAGTPGSPEGYLKMLIEHVSGIEVLSEVALESGCREIVETKKFLPAAAEVLTVLHKHTSDWYIRRKAMETAEQAHHLAIATLQEREIEKENEKRANEIRAAEAKLQTAVWNTKRYAKAIETAKAEAKAAAEAADVKIADLVEHHAQAEQRESELMRALRKLTMTPEEAEAEATAKLNGAGTKHLL